MRQAQGFHRLRGHTLLVWSEDIMEALVSVKKKETGV